MVLFRERNIDFDFIADIFADQLLFKTFDKGT